MDAIETEETSDGFTLEIYQDDSAENPRTAWDNTCSIYVPRGSRYFSGDDKAPKIDPQDFLAYLREEKAIYAPIGAYVHSGATVWLGELGGTRTETPAYDPGGWDSGMCGIIYMTREDCRAAWPKLRGKRLRAQVEKVMRAEIETWDQWVQGDVYGYSVRTPDGTCLDSCRGFYGLDFAREEAHTAFRTCVERERAAAMDYACRC